MHVRLVVRRIVLVKIINIQEYGVKCEGPKTMEFSGTAMHVTTLKDSVPLI